MWWMTWPEFILSDLTRVKHEVDDVASVTRLHVVAWASVTRLHVADDEASTGTLCYSPHRHLHVDGGVGLQAHHELVARLLARRHGPATKCFEQSGGRWTAFESRNEDW